jgi:hypothetical protein
MVARSRSASGLAGGMLRPQQSWMWTPRVRPSKTADSGDVRVQAFCPHCGTAIYATSTGDEPKAYNVRLGALRQRNELVPRREIFVRSQQPWISDLTSIPKFDGMPQR